MQISKWIMLKHPNAVSSHQPLTPFNWRPFDLYNNVDIQNKCALGHLLKSNNLAHKQSASRDTQCFCCCYCCGARHSIDRKLFTDPSKMDDDTDQTFTANYRRLHSPVNDVGAQHTRSRSVTDSHSESDKCCCCNSAIRNLVQLYFQSRDNKFNNNNGRFTQFDRIYADNLCASKGQMMPTKGICKNDDDRNHSKYHKPHRSNSCENVSDVDACDKLMDIIPKRTHEKAPFERQTQWARRKYSHTSE